MLAFENGIEGKTVVYGEVLKLFRAQGMDIAGGWEYDHGMFDTILYEHKDKTIYLRVPFKVLDGELDSHNAIIQFGTPFVIKHVMNIGLDEEESTTMTVAGLEQFQAPDDPDAPIKNKGDFVEMANKQLNYVLEDVMFAAM